MRAKFTNTLSILLLLILLSPATAFAQLFGSDEENWKKVFLELKKINHRLVTLETVEIDSLKNHLENLLREIEEVKYTVPQLQGVVELNKSETLSGLNKTNAKLDDLTAEVKNQVLSKIQQQNKTLELFREGLAQDMEKFEQTSKTNFQDFSVVNNKTLGQVVQQLEAQSATTKKGFDETIALFRADVIPAMAEENQTNRKIIIAQLTQANKDTQKNLETFSAKNQQLNQKLIKILQESLKQELETKPLLDAIKKDMGVIQEILVGTNQDIAGNHSVIAEVNKAMVITNKNLIVADEKTNKLAESLKALQVKNRVSNEALGTLKAGLEQAGEFNKLADKKFNKLIDLSSKLAVHSTELESSVTGQLKDSAQKEDTRTTKVDLANEKLSRLIEILKAVVKEQAKLDPVAKALSDIQKKQKALQKAQAGFVKDQAAIKEALADLRRKANVNISRSDDIKKTLGKLSPAKK
jgi:chromosome segregation ATPase